MLTDLLTFGQRIVDAGGWAAFFALLAFMGWGFYRGKFVLDWQYQQKVEEVKALTKSVARLTVELARERRRKDPPRGPG
jgi:hypothetical protein